MVAQVPGNGGTLIIDLFCICVSAVHSAISYPSASTNSRCNSDLKVVYIILVILDIATVLLITAVSAFKYNSKVYLELKQSSRQM